MVVCTQARNLQEPACQSPRSYLSPSSTRAKVQTHESLCYGPFSALWVYFSFTFTPRGSSGVLALSMALLNSSFSTLLSFWVAQKWHILQLTASSTGENMNQKIPVTLGKLVSYRKFLPFVIILPGEMRPSMSLSLRNFLRNKNSHLPRGKVKWVILKVLKFRH